MPGLKYSEFNKANLNCTHLNRADIKRSSVETVKIVQGMKYLYAATISEEATSGF